MDLRQFLSNARRSHDRLAFITRTGRLFYAFDWLRAGSGITIDRQPDGVAIGVDRAALSATGPNDKVAASSGDTAGYLDAKVANSVTVSGDRLQLINDSASPSADAFYGSDGASARGYHGFTEIDVVTDVGLDEAGEPLLQTRSVFVWSPADPSGYTEPTEVVATPAFTPDGGSHAGSVDVTISCATAGAAIYYTTDGSEPDDGDTLYSGPVTLAVDGTVLKARAYKAGLTTSNIKSATYTITEGGEYRWLACSDDSELAIYGDGQSHLPSHDYAWIDAGGGYVRAYLDDEVEDTPGGNPCSVQMASDPGSCGGLDYSAFDDGFDDSSFDSCRHTAIPANNGANAEGGSGLVLTFHSNGSYSVAGFNSRCPVSGDFDVSLSFSGMGSIGTYGALYFSAVIGGQWYGLGAGDVTSVPGGLKGVWRTVADVPTVYTATVPTSGSFRVVRSGASMDFYWGATLIHSATVPTTDPTFRASFEGRTPSSGTVATCTLTGITFA